MPPAQQIVRAPDPVAEVPVVQPAQCLGVDVAPQPHAVPPKRIPQVHHGEGCDPGIHTALCSAPCNGCGHAAHNVVLTNVENVLNVGIDSPVAFNLGDGGGEVR